jgi:hypothetical protein
MRVECFFGSTGVAHSDRVDDRRVLGLVMLPPAADFFWGGMYS